MNLSDAIRQRHSVRQYRETPIAEETITALRESVSEINRETGLHIQLLVNEPEAFSGKLAHYGTFRGVANYFALVGPKHAEEQLGYYGEKLVLQAQQLGLNTCWVGLNYDKKLAKVEILPGEKLYLVIAVGYGVLQGKAHRSKPMDKLAVYSGILPPWFTAAMEAAMLAPTAVNQQAFRIILDGDEVSAKSTFGPFAKLDLGIVKYHFEIGAEAAGHPIHWSE